MSYNWLTSFEQPAPGLLLGPASSPERYELVEEIHGAHHPRIKQKDAPMVWMAKEKQSGDLVAIKILCLFGRPELYPLCEAQALWNLVGHLFTLTGKHVFVPSPHPGQAHCITILDFFLFPSEKAFFNSVSNNFDFAEPGDWKTASAEQLLLRHAEYNRSQCTAVDIWAVGNVTSLLLFNKNLAFGNLAIKPVYPLYKSPLERWGASPAVMVSLASLEPEVEWPAFLSESGEVDYASNYPFNFSGIEPVATLQERIEAEEKVTDPEEARQLRSCLRACWTLDPYKRPTAKELLEHEWLRGVE
ncbi:hypothetical protein JCM8547_007088 [Rhodosporidiobolus lusitaniae]